jgi:hypothetical protein
VPSVKFERASLRNILLLSTMKSSNKTRKARESEMEGDLFFFCSSKRNEEVFLRTGVPANRTCFSLEGLNGLNSVLLLSLSSFCRLISFWQTVHQVEYKGAPSDIEHAISKLSEGKCSRCAFVGRNFKSLKKHFHQNKDHSVVEREGRETTSVFSKGKITTDKNDGGENRDKGKKDMLGKENVKEDDAVKVNQETKRKRKSALLSLLSDDSSQSDLDSSDSSESGNEAELSSDSHINGRQELKRKLGSSPSSYTSAAEEPLPPIPLTLSPPKHHHHEQQKPKAKRQKLESGDSRMNEDSTTTSKPRNVLLPTFEGTNDASSLSSSSSSSASASSSSIKPVHHEFEGIPLHKSVQLIRNNPDKYVTVETIHILLKYIDSMGNNESTTESNSRLNCASS